MNQAISISPEVAAPVERAVNWPRVGLFLGVTFSITWLLNLGLYLTGGLANKATMLVLITQMLIPAFSAILLQTFFFSDSPLYFKVHRGPARWFTYFYLAATVLAIAGSVAVLLSPGLLQPLSTPLSSILIVGMLVFLVARWRGGKDSFAGIGMAGGLFRWWVILGGGMVAFYALQTLLNYLFHLGTVVDITKVLPSGGMSPLAAQGLMLLNAMILGPLTNLLPFFGEEYGWRGFLQPALDKLGRIQGTFLVGVIWGLWHAPIILMGYNYPDNPLLGVLLMTLYCIGLAYFLAYAVYKSKGVWTAAFLHGINNNIISFFFGMVYAPASTILSFGAGVYGLACLAIIVLLLLRDPLWREK